MAENEITKICKKCNRKKCPDIIDCDKLDVELSKPNKQHYIYVARNKFDGKVVVGFKRLLSISNGRMFEQRHFDKKIQELKKGEQVKLPVGKAEVVE